MGYHLVYHTPLRWRHNDHAGVSNHQPHGCSLNRLFRRKPKKTSKLRVTGLCAGNSPGTGEFPAQMASYAENVSIWWRHHAPVGSCNQCLGDLSWRLVDCSVSRYYTQQTIFSDMSVFFFQVYVLKTIFCDCECTGQNRGLWGNSIVILKRNLFLYLVLDYRADSTFASSERRRYFVTTFLIGWAQT